MQKMTVAELVNRVNEVNSLFFSKEVMSYFGDRFSNFGVRSETIDGVEYWELYRKRPVKGGLSSSSYFDKVTFQRHVP